MRERGEPLRRATKLLHLEKIVPYKNCLPSTDVLLKQRCHTFSGRAVPIPIPVLENASDTAKNAGNSIDEHTSLCANPCDILATERYLPVSLLSAV